MRFRHLYRFNLAMPGKQCWHLVTNHDTILSKVFKAIYYLNEGFLEAKLGHNPSYVCRSIHTSQVIVKKRFTMADWKWRTNQCVMCGTNHGSELIVKHMSPLT
jgi:hypothetical protein